MLVPLIPTVLQLLLVTELSLFADTIFDPGTTISGLNRPSSVGPQLEKPDIVPALLPRCVDPTERTLFPVDGVDTVAVPGPEFPAANTSKKSLWSHMNWSASCVAAL